jgi:hypothetical protein
MVERATFAIQFCWFITSTRGASGDTNVDIYRVHRYLDNNNIAACVDRRGSESKRMKVIVVKHDEYRIRTDEKYGNGRPLLGSQSCAVQRFPPCESVISTASLTRT